MRVHVVSTPTVRWSDVVGPFIFSNSRPDGRWSRARVALIGIFPARGLRFCAAAANASPQRMTPKCNGDHRISYHDRKRGGQRLLPEANCWAAVPFNGVLGKTASRRPP